MSISEPSSSSVVAGQVELRGLLVDPITQRVRDWLASGKLDEDDVDDALTSDARTHVDLSVGEADWVPIAQVEELVTLVAGQVGGETGLVEWADSIVAQWLLDPVISRLVSGARGLSDGPGFVVSQAGEYLARRCPWQYEGGRDRFSVRLTGLADVSPAMKSLLGACLARLAAAVENREFDVRFDGVDRGDLRIFGEAEACGDDHSESQLHRAALVP